MKPLTDLIGYNELRALSWKEPYGSLMLQGKIETRTWYTDYRGWVLMCASKVPYPREVVYGISGEQMHRINATFGFDDQYKGAGYCGYAFAVGFLAECRRMKESDEKAAYVTYYPDLFSHIYEKVQKIEPFPWRGSQGWRIVKPETINQIILL